MPKKLKVYHGTNATFSKFDQGKARITNDLYGGGVAYFTANTDIAYNYAKSMAKSKGGQKQVYEVELNVNKLFDVNHIFTGKELTQFFTPKTSEEFARGAGLLSYGVDKYGVLIDLESGKLKLTGDQVFHGLSKGMNSTAKAREKLISLKYDTLRYNGGVNMNATRHDVYIAYKAENITIKNHYMYDDQGRIISTKR